MNKNKKGFTLIEVMVSLFLSVMVAFFVYTMMISSYNSYRRLSSISKNANSIRYFITSFSNSIKYCEKTPEVSTMPDGGKCIIFTRYDKVYNDTIKERYYFSSGGELIQKDTYSVNVAGAPYNSGKLGLFKKDLLRADDTLIETITISNIIRTIYFYCPAPGGTDRLRKMNVSVIYDDVIDGNIDKDSGVMKARADDKTEMKTTDTLTRRLFCFCFRGFF